MKLGSKIVICLLVCISIMSCEKEKNFPDTPELEFRDFYKTSDTSAVWILGFKDGDGNLGIGNDPNLSDNFPTQIYIIEDGVVSFDTSGQGFRIPKISGVETDGGIEGELQLSLTGLDFFTIVGYDSLYYSGYLIDQDGNESNVVETPVFRVN